VLGSAAGGGVPQWNCSCANCQAARDGKVQKRTQSSIAIAADASNLFLVNASPDLPLQIQAASALQPKLGPVRNSPISDILLTNADLDHVLGLFSLREGGPLHIHASVPVRATLENCLGLTNILGAFCGIVWHEVHFEQYGSLPGDYRRIGSASGGALQYRAIMLAGTPPAFAKQSLPNEVHSVAYQFLDPQTGGRLLVAPDVAALNDELCAALHDSNAVLFDGTFWSPDELSALKPGARSADQMGHITIQRSLEFLKAAPARTKAYIHLNNTNPVLAPDSREGAAVKAAGIEVAYDGMEFEL